MLSGQGTRITCQFVINKYFLTRLIMHASKAGGSPDSVTQDGLETGDVSPIVENASSGARLPGLDLDPVTL